MTERQADQQWVEATRQQYVAASLTDVADRMNVEDGGDGSAE